LPGLHQFNATELPEAVSLSVQLNPLPFFLPFSVCAGRRRELMVAAALYAAGAACTAGAPSLPLLLLGRLIFGVGIGLVSSQTG